MEDYYFFLKGNVLNFYKTIKSKQVKPASYAPFHVYMYMYLYTRVNQ